MINVLVGTRAQLIKMAPVLLALERSGVVYRLVMSGQHQVTMAELLQEFGVTTRPLHLYQGREITGVAQMGRWFLHMLWRGWRQRERLFVRADGGRNAMVVHGDTVSTLLGALLGRLLGMEVVHIESGLTSGRWREPFPEELTRRLVFRLAHVAFCPDAWAANNMRAFKARVIDTGANTIIDAVQEAMGRFADTQVEMPAAPYAVVSLHRFENIFEAQRFAFIIVMLERMALRIPLVFVLHPATRKQAEKFGLLARLEDNSNIHLEPRMTYIPFLKLLCGARFVVSDGGSNQEELAWLGIPTLLMRGATERQDGLGASVVVSNYNAEVIAGFVDEVLARKDERKERAAVQSPSAMIAKMLAENYL
ncbi:MAG: UDP-N-acetylglucosamine 2-epimerase [Gammaproteobacteria bacterium]|nr:UDP-N-acetylglucosamine 2-epimerase [Gammaproteobacteria bacterium]